MSGRGRGRGSGQNELLAQIAAVLANVNENLQHLNQNATPSPSLQPLVPPEPAEYRGNGSNLSSNELFGGSEVGLLHIYASEEAENWWEFTRRQMETEGQLISWGIFKEKFLHKYFPADLKWKKEMEFLKLEQGNMLLEVDGRSKCSKFESGLRPKLKRMFRHQEIADFATLVNKCRMYEDDLKVDELATPETISPRNYGPQCSHMRERGKGRVDDDRKPYVATTIHRDRSFQRSRPPTVPAERVSTPMCNKCGRLHYGSTCLGKGNGCFHCKEFGHMKRFCPKLDRRPNSMHAEGVRDHSWMVTPSGAGTSDVDDPTRGKSHGDRYHF
ncbi:hypothetical protein Lal_00049042 [Lupinus albus]|nr:hypothetical protein Lal_00049042 [Lupinus albus]